MKEGVVDVELMYRPVALSSQREHYAHHCRFHDGTVCLAVINSCALGEPAHHPSCLVPIKAAIFLELVAEDPFAANGMCTRRSLNELPCFVGE
jgi:hypothetical protein